MAAPHNVEFEAAKFLQKLIQESTDEPARLATKLYVILQHMKASGKENSMPYQVISRAMETVINQHGLDIEALTSSRPPPSTGPQAESAITHVAGSSQTLPATDSKSGMAENDATRIDGYGSCRPPAAPTSLGHDLFQGSVSQRSGRSFDHESPSSIDTKSTNSLSQDRRETASWEHQGAQNHPKRVNVKRKKSDSSALESPDDAIPQIDSFNTVPDLKKERLTSKAEMQGNLPGVSESWKQGFVGATNFRETAVPVHLLPPNQANVSMANFSSASHSDAPGRQMSADRLLQTANLSSVNEMGTQRGPASRDIGKAPAISNMPFKEHHLKQLRAQCLVFLAFRNGLAPKRLHLEVALGNIVTQEGLTGSVEATQNELLSDKGKQPTTLESSCTAEATLPRLDPGHANKERAVIGTAPSGCGPEVDAILTETKSVKPAGAKMDVLDDSSYIDRSGMITPAVRSYEASLMPGTGTNHGDHVLGTNKPLKPEMTRWTGVAQNDFSRSPLLASIPHELNRKDGSSDVSQHEGGILNLQRAENHMSTSLKAVQGAEDVSKMVPVFDSSYIHTSPSPLGSEPEEEDKSVSAGLASSPKLTLSEKWILPHQKRKVANEQKWALKLQKTDQRIASRFSELKETVSSSEDISAKTKSVIELKKLQLLELQRRLRRNIINDFFKPVQSEMDQLKSIKKHRIGRRMKHVEKYEQKMKEERQKRIRERQKEFFSEVEVHKERLEDLFKFKRERCKAFNRHVKEFHKRKERIYREKIDRIQREKINLLKINDVEGYLRMVKDAKSDRVKQLLKETEKYLQKLGSKLQEAKTSAREADIDENRIATFDESSENAAETEDEKDQAKHYKESNEKYYLIAHSIKESITEQPAGILGGKLREYQMNGLRWLVSLYNNHLNGILADEMGLGKTVQVISLLCYLMEAKNDRGPFLVVVPSSVLPGWEREMSFWAPGINKIVYTGPPEERRRLFKESIVHQKFNVLLTTYEYLMNKHDRPKLSKIHWHYVIIDEGHRIKNASCKLNAELKHYHSSHRLLLTGTPLQNSLEELWALLNFLLPNIFNSSDDFSQWFNKPFEGSGDNSLDEALLSEEENLLIINRLHQVLRPFVLRRLKHKVENELPEKIERLVRCEASAYQKLLMTRVEENLGSLGATKGRAIHNSVMELRNICNHPYLSQLHVEEVDSLIPKHFLPPIIRLCGKLEMLDRLLPKLKETNHRVLFFSTMTRLLDVMEDYLVWKQYRYLRLDGHTSGQDRGALIEKFNQPDSPFFIFLLSIRAGGVGVNLQAADTVIIFDTDWNPQVDLQAQARAHRIGQKKDVLVLRLETVKSVEEQVRAAAEHKLGVANQSITAGFFDNNTSAEDRREYLESLLRESKKEEAAPVLDDDSLNDILARSEPEIEVFEAIDQKRREEEMATWKTLFLEHGGDGSEALPPLPSRLVTDDDLKAFYEAMKVHEAPNDGTASSSGVKRKGGYIGGFDSQQYGRGKRAREVRSYEEQWSEEEFEKMCQSEFPRNILLKDEKVDMPQPSEFAQIAVKVEIPVRSLQPPPPSLEPSSLVKKEDTPSARRGRGRPKRTPTNASPSVGDLGTATIKRRGRKPSCALPPVHIDLPIQDLVSGEQLKGPSSDTRVSLNSGGKVISGDSSADCSHESLPKCSESSDTLILKDTKALELSAENNSFVESSKAATSPTRVVTDKNDAPSHSRNGPVQNLMGVKFHEQSVKHATSDLSAAYSAPYEEEGNKVDVVHQGQVLPIFKSSGGSAALSTSGGTPLMKAESHIDNPKPSSEAMPTSIMRTGRKQTQKPQNAGEPVRRRGRKRGATVLDDSIPLVVQDQNSLKPLKTSTTSVTYVVPTTDVSPVNVAVTHLVPVSTFATGSADVTAVSGSMRRGSKGSVPREITVDLQAKGQAQREECTEIAPRRRGRKKSTVSPAGLVHSVGQYSFSRQPDGKDEDFAERKVIATRSRLVNVSQSESTLGDMHSVSTFTVSASKDSMATVSYTSPDIPKPCIGESASIMAETRHKSAADDMKKFARPSDFPPISSKGKTNVIVLALDVASLDVDPVGMGGINSHEKKEFPNLQIESTASASKLNVELSGFNATHATRTEVATLDEELSAPPGFETSRPCASNAATTKSGEQNDCRISNSPDAKIGPVVLALRSSPQTSVPSIKCHNISEKEETLEVKSFKVSGHETVVPLPPDGRTATPEAATDEDLLAPPGFDIPQQRLLESEAVKTPVCAESDMPAASAVKVRLEEDYPVTSGQDTHDTGGALRTSIAVGSTNAAASTVDSEEGKNCLTPRLGTSEAPLAVRVVDSETVGAVTLKSEEKEDILGPGRTEQNLVDASTASVAVPCTAAVTTLESKGREELYDKAEQNVVDASTASFEGPYIEVISPLESKAQEESRGPDHSKLGLHSSDASVAVSMVDSDATAALSFKIKEKTANLGRDSTDENVVDGAATSGADFNYAAASVLGLKEQKESHGPDCGIIEHKIVCASDSDTAAILTLGLEEKGEHLGSGDSEQIIVASDGSADGPSDGPSHGPESTRQNIIGASSAFFDGLQNATTSVLELKEHEESHGPENGDTGNDSRDASLAVGAVDCNTEAALNLESKDIGQFGIDSSEQNPVDASAASVAGSDIATTSALESQGSDCDTTGHVLSDAPLTVSLVGSDIASAVNCDSNGNIDLLGSDTSEQNVVDASAASIDSPHLVKTSAVELKEEEKTQGCDGGDIGQDTGDALLAVCLVDPNTASALAMELDEKELGSGNMEPNVVDAFSAYEAGPCNSASTLESNEQEKSHGLDDCNVQCDAAGSPSSVMAGNDATEALNPEPQIGKLFHGSGGDLNIGSGGDLNVTDSVLAMELKEEEKTHGFRDDLSVTDAVSAMELKEGETTHGAGGDLSIGTSGDHNATDVSTMESKEEEQTHGGDLNIGPGDLNVTDIVSAKELREEEKTWGAGGSDLNIGSGGDLKVTDAVSAVELKGEEKTHGSGCDVNIGSGGDLSATDIVSAMELKEEEKTQGAGGDLEVTGVVSAMELKEEEKTPGPNDGKAEDNADDNPTTSHDVSVDTVVETTSKPNEKND